MLLTITTHILLSNMRTEIRDSSTNSSDSEEDEEDIPINELELIYGALMVAETRGEAVYKEKIEDYVERVIPNYSRIVFKEYFR